MNLKFSIVLTPRAKNVRVNINEQMRHLLIDIYVQQIIFSKVRAHDKSVLSSEINRNQVHAWFGTKTLTNNGNCRNGIDFISWHEAQVREATETTFVFFESSLDRSMAVPCRNVQSD